MHISWELKSGDAWREFAWAVICCRRCSPRSHSRLQADCSQSTANHTLIRHSNLDCYGGGLATSLAATCFIHYDFVIVNVSSRSRKDRLLSPCREISSLENREIKVWATWHRQKTEGNKLNKERRLGRTSVVI